MEHKDAVCVCVCVSVCCSLSLSLSISHTYSLSLTLTYSHSLTHSPSPSLPPSNQPASLCGGSDLHAMAMQSEPVGYSDCERLFFRLPMRT